MLIHGIVTVWWFTRACKGHICAIQLYAAFQTSTLYTSFPRMHPDFVIRTLKPSSCEITFYPRWHLDIIRFQQRHCSRLVVAS